MASGSTMAAVTTSRTPKKRTARKGAQRKTRQGATKNHTPAPPPTIKRTANQALHDDLSEMVPDSQLQNEIANLERQIPGVHENLEDPDEYSEDLEWACSRDFQSAEPANNIEAKQTYINKTYRILFRNKLEGKAEEWYSNLGAPIRKDLGSAQSFLPLVLQIGLARLTDKALGEES